MRRPWPQRAHRRIALLGLLCLPLLMGCVQKYLHVTSEPSGARVYLDGFEMGYTPALIQFDHFGTRELMVQAQHDPESTQATEDYALWVENIELSPPWYLVFPLDFFSEFLWPGELVHTERVHVKLEPEDFEARRDEWIEAARKLGLPVGEPEASSP